MLTELLAVFGIVNPLAMVVEFGVVVGLVYFAAKYYDKK